MSYREGMAIGNAFAQIGGAVGSEMKRRKVIADEDQTEKLTTEYYGKLIKGEKIDPSTVTDTKALSEATLHASRFTQFQMERKKQGFVKTTNEMQPCLKKMTDAYKAGDDNAGNLAGLDLYGVIKDGVDVKKDESGNPIIKDGKFTTVNSQTGEEEEHPYTKEYIMGQTKTYIVDEDGNFDKQKWVKTYLGAWEHISAGNRELEKDVTEYTGKDGKTATSIKQFDQATQTPETIYKDANGNLMTPQEFIDGKFRTVKQRSAAADLRAKLEAPGIAAQKRLDGLTSDAIKEYNGLLKAYMKEGGSADGLQQADTTKFIEQYGTQDEYVAKHLAKFGIKAKAKPEEKPNPVEMDAATVKAINGLTDARKKAFLAKLEKENPEDWKKYNELNGTGGEKETPGKDKPAAKEDKAKPEKKADRKKMQSVSDTERAKRTKAAKKAERSRWIKAKVKDLMGQGGDITEKDAKDKAEDAWNARERGKDTVKTVKGALTKIQGWTKRQMLDAQDTHGQ